MSKGAINLALDELLDEADAYVAEAVRGVAVAATTYAIANTPEWSGDLVAQWRVVPKGKGATYTPIPGHAGKSSAAYDRNTPIPAGRDEPYSRWDPNKAAVARAVQNCEADINSIEINTWVGGVQLINAHPHATQLLNAPGTPRQYMPADIGTMIKAFVGLKMKAYGEAQSLRTSNLSRTKKLRPIRLTGESKAGLQDRGYAKTVREELKKTGPLSMKAQRDKKSREARAASKRDKHSQPAVSGRAPKKVTAAKPVTRHKETAAPAHVQAARLELEGKIRRVEIGVSQTSSPTLRAVAEKNLQNLRRQLAEHDRKYKKR